MKKIFILPIAVALLSVCACSGNKTNASAEGADTVEAVDSDSIRQADSIAAAEAQAKADSIAKAKEDSTKQAQAQAANSKKAQKAIDEYRTFLGQLREAQCMEGSHNWERYVNANEYCIAECKAQLKNMTPEQKAEYKRIENQAMKKFQNW